MPGPIDYPVLNESDQRRFDSKIEERGGCLIWKPKSPYFSVNGVRYVSHILAWKKAGKTIPPRHVIVPTKCGNSRCVESEHREVVRAGLPPWRGEGVSPKFWSKVNKLGPTPKHDPALGACWVWTAALDGKGYGVFNDNSTVTKAHLAHYRRSVGPVPTGMFLDHKCFNRSCVRLEHLRVLDTAGNNQNRGGAQSNSATGVRGVVVTRSGRFRGEARVGGLSYSKTFQTLEEAEAGVSAWRRENMPSSYMDQLKEVA